MVRKAKLLARVRNNSRDVRFSDLLALVEGAGFILIRQRGTSDRRYLHPETETYLNLQPDKNGKAEPYQVREFIEALDSLGLDIEES